jgi:hypothetical protein
MERRAIPRTPVLMSGAIQFAGCLINCLVCDMTISGAALEVAEPHDIPERFSLVLGGRHAHSLSRRLAPRGPDRRGLRLIPTFGFVCNVADWHL